MESTCPKCGWSHSIDAALLAVPKPFWCVRCASSYVAVLRDGKVKTFLSRESDDTQKYGAVAQNQGAPVIQALPNADEVLELPEPVLVFEPAAETTLDLEDLLFVPPSHQDSKLSTEASSTGEQPQGFGALFSSERSEPHLPAASSVPKSWFARKGHPLSVSVSQLWLLVSGLLLISFIFLISWSTRPDAQANDLTLKHASMNSAINMTAQRTASPAPDEAVEMTPESSYQYSAPAVAPASVINSGPVMKLSPVVEAKATREISPSQPDNPQDGSFTIQVGSYNQITQADERAARLKAAGLDARVVQAVIPKRGTWYRVQTGRFFTRDEATRYITQLRSKGLAQDGFITEAGE